MFWPLGSSWATRMIGVVPEALASGPEVVLPVFEVEAEQ
jgi:hypothetical protein